MCHKFLECGHRWRILINVYEKLQHKVFAVSKGYREYKTTDGYSNDILALMVEQNSTDA